MRRTALAVALALVTLGPGESLAQHSSVVISHVHGGPGFGLHRRSQFFSYDYSATHFSGAPLVQGYVAPYVVAYPYVYEVWPYYLDTGTGPLGPYIAPPLYVPPEQFGFGPQAMIRQFAGIASAPAVVNRQILVAPPRGEAIQDEGGPQNDAADNVARPRVRESNAEARGRARRFIELGDAQFAARNVAAAYDRYRKAAAAAPDLAEAHFRQGQALADLARYEQAAAAFRRGLGLRPDWPDSGFRLAELYGHNQAAQQSAVQRAEHSAAARLDDSNLQFVAGVQFFFVGQADKARQHFERAAALGEAAASVEPFLKLLANLAEAELDI